MKRGTKKKTALVTFDRVVQVLAAVSPIICAIIAARLTRKS